MGILDDIKNMKPLQEHKWTLKKLFKVEKKLLKKSQKSILKELMKKDKIKFINKNKNGRYYCGIDLSNKDSSELIYIKKNFAKLSIESLNYNKNGNNINENNKNNNSNIIKCSNGIRITINKNNINDFIITDDDVSKVVEILKKEML